MSDHARIDGSLADLIVAASRHAVAQIAPAESEVFDGVADGWRADVTSGRRDWTVPGSSVGFGIDSTLVTEVVIQASAAAVAEVLIGAGRGLGRGWRRWWRRRATPANTAPTSDVVSSAGAAGVDTARLRDACLRHGVALGLSADQALLLADALVGSLAPDQP